MKSMRQLREQVGELLVMGFEGESLSPALVKLISELQPGGVILFARNVHSASQTHALLKDCRRLVATPMFLCVDMEGGTVDRLKHAVAPAPSAVTVFASGEKKYFLEHGRLIGEECRALGFNIDFAPTSDLAFAASRSVLGSRAVSADPAQVATYVGEFLRGLKDARVLGCGKHFPGLGEANLDSHHALPSIEKNWKDLWEQDLAPYRALRRLLPFVMVAHASFPNIAPDSLPASSSSFWIKEVLRGKIGYRGLVISDDLEMAGALVGGSVAEAAVATLRAGADLFLVSHREELVRAAFEAVLRAAEQEHDFARAVARAAQRIVAFKARRAELKRFPSPPSLAKIEKLRSQMNNFSRSLPS